MSLSTEERAIAFARNWSENNDRASSSKRPTVDSNPCQKWFESVQSGPGVHKWMHYFEIYHRHLHKFIGRQLNMVEIGVHSGGSLLMWRNYFGELCHIHGIDAQPECKEYENSHTTIHIGRQEDRAFWDRFKKAVPFVDVLIDDGGHVPEHQIVSLEEMLAHLRPGGVYLCEDVHRIGNQFAGFVHSLASELNVWAPIPRVELVSNPSPFQQSVHSVHFYPFVVVIERHETAPVEFIARKHGTEWQSF